MCNDIFVSVQLLQPVLLSRILLTILLSTSMYNDRCNCYLIPKNQALIITNGLLVGAIYTNYGIDIPSVTLTKPQRHVLTQISDLKREIRTHLNHVKTNKNATSERDAIKPH